MEKKLMVAISEKEFQNKVIALAIMYGWRVTHFRASQVGGKWMTAIQGHSGFPDLTMVHPHKGLVFEAYVWRPSDMQFITNRLLNGAPLT